MPGDVEDVLHVHQADVGAGQQAAGKAEAANLGGGEAGGFNDAGAEGVMTPGHNEGLPALQRGTQNGCLIIHE